MTTATCTAATAITYPANVGNYASTEGGTIIGTDALDTYRRIATMNNGANIKGGTIIGTDALDIH